MSLGVRSVLALACLTLFGCATRSGEFLPAAPQGVTALATRAATASVQQPLKAQRLPELQRSLHTMQHFSAIALTCDGKTDVSAQLQATIEQVGQAGGGIIDLPNGICATSQTIEVNYSNVTLLGQGAGYGADAPATIATGLLWIGAPGGTLLQYGSSSSSVSGDGLDGIALLSNTGSAAYGLMLAGSDSGSFMSFTTDAFSAASIQLGSASHNLFSNYNLDDEINTGASIVVGSATNVATTGNEFDDGFIQIANGTGVELLQSQGNVFTDTHEFMDKGGLGLGVLFGCGSTDDQFVWLSAGYSNNHNGVDVDGTPRCTRHTVPKNDSIQLYDQNDNGGPPPVVGNHVTFACTNDAGKPCGAQSPHHN